jgi:uncharacterized protein
MAPAPTTAIRIDQIICELAGQGRRVLMGVLGVVLPQDLQRTSALKNVLSGLVNAVARLCFAFAAHVEWGPARITARASMVGGQLGAHYCRRLHPTVLSGVIVVVGVTAIGRLLVT